MAIEERNNEFILKRIEEFKSATDKDIPSKVFEILEHSDKSNQAMEIHTSAKDLLKG